MIIWNRENKKQAVAAPILLAAGIINGILAESYIPAGTASPIQAMPLREEIFAFKDVKRIEINESESNIEETVSDEYEPSITQLNLAYYFPEGADQSDVMNSYAGTVYKKLTIKDSDWLAAIYDLADIKPAKMASRLGKPLSAVYGKYNPMDETHDPDNPDTWLINSWKKVNLSFVNGSGKAISGYSNVKEILSMASVYTFQTDVMDVEHFEEYANRLWTASHSYSYSMGKVYYCGGCLDLSMEELIQEEEEAELAAELASSQEPWSTDYIEDSEPDQTEKVDSLKAVSKEKDAETSQEYEKSNDGIIPSSVSQETEEAGPAVPIAESGSNGGTIRKNTVDPHQWDNIGPGQELMATPGNAAVVLEDPYSPEDSSASCSTDETEESFPQSQESLEADASKSKNQAKEKSSSSKPSDAKSTTQKKTSSSDGKGDCPGHVDLNISIKILGIDDSKGLLHADTIGNNPENMTEDGWDGWDSYSIQMAKAIRSQDWYKNYGLSISTISMRNPLSAGEIESYIDKLPGGTSRKRRELIQFALSSVGKVPYYWGGKPSHSGYEGNFFGTPINPDTKGRILKGLDCSGWINWVYWSVTGERLAGESTSSLALCGRPIKRSELKPGDIILKTGTGAHVVMFLGWAPNGQMKVIHESSGSVNNVTVKTMEADWPYYRNLID